MPLEENDQPGWFKIEDIQAGHAWIQYNCPCGCGVVGQLPLVPEGKKQSNHDWVWDGNVTHPTLSPSILRTIGCRFHGWLRNGVWSSAGDGARLAANVYRAP
jgi:hypothetical protein